MNTTTAAAARSLLPLFYLVPPSESSFEKLEEVPNYLNQVIPYFFVLIGLEALVRWFQDKPLPRVNDSISSLTAGIFLQFGHVIIGAFEVSSYVWVHSRFCVYPLPWNSVATWWLAMILIDFCYYWFHRMSHEVNLFWAAHQMHHSSQDYTLSTALRQSVLQRFNSWMIYLPLALFMPPPMYLVHKEFNLLYQFWIHTEVVNKLGPLEWVLNTPSHHRVHHGTNPYCIDKNYAGVLIIWDKIFGTFAEEKEQVYYGLLHQPETWNPLYAQFFQLAHVMRRVWAHNGIWEKLRFLFYSPSWTPGHGRMGVVYSEPYPPISPHLKSRFGKPTSVWLTTYCIVHFTLILYLSMELEKLKITYLVSLVAIGYLILCLTNFGLMFDLRPECAQIEVLRLVVLLVVDYSLSPHSVITGIPLHIIRWINVFSVVLWSLITLRQLRQSQHLVQTK